MKKRIKNYRNFLRFKQTASLVKEQIQQLGGESKIKTCLLMMLWFLPLGMLWVLLVIILRKKFKKYY